MKGYVQSIGRRFIQGGLCYEMEVTADMLRLGSILLSRYVVPEEKLSQVLPPALGISEMQKAVAYIEKHFTEDLTLKVHNYGEHVASSEWTVAKEPTCSEKGSRHKTCTLCGDAIENEEIDMIPHTWETECTVDVEPTCVSEGSQSIHCAVCGAIDKDSVQTIPDLKEGWYEEEVGWRYYYDDGTYPTSSFHLLH